MPEQIPTCVACASPLSARPHVRTGGIALFRCEACGSLTAWPRPTAAQQEGLHDNADYFEHPYFESRRQLSNVVRRRYQKMFEAIEGGIDRDQLRGQRHLDVGCDTGIFLLAAGERFGTQPVGIDVAQRPVAEAAQHGIEAHCCSLEALPGASNDFALITAIDVIEHVVDPASFVAEISRRLRPGGITYIETPNIRSMVYRGGRALSRVTGNHPAWVFERLFPAEHIQYFSVAGLTDLATRAGLEVVSISSRALPMPDIAAGIAVRVAMASLQALDAGPVDKILLRLLARRPRAR